jgi:hypothetical protein
MANSALSQLFSVSPLKIVNEANGYEYWAGLAVKSVDVMLDSAVTDNPLSNKSFTEEALYVDILDVDTRNGKIIRPVKLKMTLLSTDLSTIESMMGALANASQTFSITSKAIISDSMMLIDLTINQKADMVSAHELIAEFEQAEPPIPVEFDPENPSNRSNFGIRIQLPTSILADGIRSVTGNLTGSVESLYNRVASNF